MILPLPMLDSHSHPDLVDPVLEEVRRIKIELLERWNYDLIAMGRDAQERQWHSGHPVVDLSGVIHPASPQT